MYVVRSAQWPDDSTRADPKHRSISDLKLPISWSTNPLPLEVRWFSKSRGSYSYWTFRYWLKYLIEYPFYIISQFIQEPRPTDPNSFTESQWQWGKMCDQNQDQPYIFLSIESEMSVTLLGLDDWLQFEAQVLVPMAGETDYAEFGPGRLLSQRSFKLQGIFRSSLECCVWQAYRSRVDGAAFGHYRGRGPWPDSKGKDFDRKRRLAKKTFSVSGQAKFCKLYSKSTKRWSSNCNKRRCECLVKKVTLMGKTNNTE